MKNLLSFIGVVILGFTFILLFYFLGLLSYNVFLYFTESRFASLLCNIMFIIFVIVAGNQVND